MEINRTKNELLLIIKLFQKELHQIDPILNPDRALIFLDLFRELSAKLNEESE